MITLMICSGWLDGDSCCNAACCLKACMHENKTFCPLNMIPPPCAPVISAFPLHISKICHTRFQMQCKIKEDSRTTHHLGIQYRGIYRLWNRTPQKQHSSRENANSGNISIGWHISALNRRRHTTWRRMDRRWSSQLHVVHFLFSQCCKYVKLLKPTNPIVSLNFNRILPQIISLYNKMVCTCVQNMKHVSYHIFCNLCVRLSLI